MSFAAKTDPNSSDAESIVDANYDGLNFGRKELMRVMRETYDDIIAFVSTPSFAAFYVEMMSLDPKLRPEFIRRVLFQPDEMRQRGIVIPEGVLIQTSAFGDRRPTLFAVKKMMPEKYQVVWENMNMTFNNEYNDDDVSRSDEDAWRPPLPVALQNALLAHGADLESVPTEFGIKFGIYSPETGTK